MLQEFGASLYIADGATFQFLSFPYPTRMAIARLEDRLVGDSGSTPREWRASFLRRGPAREARARVLAWEPERLVIAHGACAKEGGNERRGSSNRRLPGSETALRHWSYFARGYGDRDAR